MTKEYEAGKIPVVADLVIGVTEWQGEGDSPVFPAIEIFYKTVDQGPDDEEQSMLFVLTSELALVAIIEECENVLRTHFATADEGESE